MTHELSASNGFAADDEVFGLDELSDSGSHLAHMTAEAAVPFSTGADPGLIAMDVLSYRKYGVPVVIGLGCLGLAASLATHNNLAGGLSIGSIMAAGGKAFETFVDQADVPTPIS
jgi:hypothetical protein